MRVLAINNETREKIKTLMESARATPIPLDVLNAGTVDGPVITLKDRPPGFKRPQSGFVLIPFGFRASYSVEAQPAGLNAHLSIGLEDASGLPNREAVKHIMRAFDMADKIAKAWIEEYEPGRYAVNLLAPLDWS